MKFKNILAFCDSREQVDSKSLADALSRLTTFDGTGRARFTLCDTEAIVGDERRRDQSGSDKLSRLVAFAESMASNIPVDVEMLAGAVPVSIAALVLERDFDLVVLATNPAQRASAGLTPQQLHVIRDCPVPVWAMDANWPGRYENIIAAVDVNDPMALPLVRAARSFALAHNARLHLMHAWPSSQLVDGEQAGDARSERARTLLARAQELDQLRERQFADSNGEERLAIDIDTLMAAGDPAEMVLRAVNDLRA
ncbi:MAG: universal stress protein, partial [Gammaproteobacteria bacterium]|nr:universal stress protein [Gammaproteobacteria bacterium]